MRYVVERSILPFSVIIGFVMLMMLIAPSAIGKPNKDDLKISLSGHYIQYLGKTLMLIGEAELSVSCRT
jgi:hypothetical protein